MCPLQIEHIVPRARGGSNRVTNLTLACDSCNIKKGTQTAAEFGHPEVQAQAKLPRKRCRSRQCYPLGLVPTTHGFGIASGSRDGRAHQVEPDRAPTCLRYIGWMPHALAPALQRFCTSRESFLW